MNPLYLRVQVFCIPHHLLCSEIWIPWVLPRTATGTGSALPSVGAGRGLHCCSTVSHTLCKYRACRPPPHPAPPRALHTGAVQVSITLCSPSALGLSVHCHTTAGSVVPCDGAVLMSSKGSPLSPPRCRHRPLGRGVKRGQRGAAERREAPDISSGDSEAVLD